MALRPKYSTMSIRELSDLYDEGLLDLSPPFQRDSVWSRRDRDLLVDSVVLGIPLPAIFLYELDDSFQVIDGKQRLETIMRFLGSAEFADDPLVVSIALPGRSHKAKCSWGDLSKAMQQHVLRTRVPIVTVHPDGGIAEVIDLFVRLNSTGKRLTGMERRKAQYFESDTLNFAQELAVDLRSRFVDLGVLTETHISRLVHIELTLELLLSIAQGQPLNKKSAIDQIIDGTTIPREQLRAAANRLKRALTDAEAIWDGGVSGSPSLEYSRFTHLSDFFSLIFFLADRRRGLPRDLVTGGLG